MLLQSSAELRLMHSGPPSCARSVARGGRRRRDVPRAAGASRALRGNSRQPRDTRETPHKPARGRCRSIPGRIRTSDLRIRTPLLEDGNIAKQGVCAARRRGPRSRPRNGRRPDRVRPPLGATGCDVAGAVGGCPNRDRGHGGGGRGGRGVSWPRAWGQHHRAWSPARGAGSTKLR